MENKPKQDQPLDYITREKIKTENTTLYNVVLNNKQTKGFMGLFGKRGSFTRTLAWIGLVLGGIYLVKTQYLDRMGRRRRIDAEREADVLFEQLEKRK